MYLTVKMVVKFQWDQYALAVAFVSCGIALALSILISLASFHLFEKWFLRLKDRFAFIVKK
jgi:peptidoglycan/LPS O-acetylase OafA/YrhL